MAALEVFITVFGLMFIAELADKTELAILSLSLKFHEKRKVFLGAWLAHVLLDGVAILLGAELALFFNSPVVKDVLGLIFVVIGIYMVLKKESEKVKKLDHRVFLASFLTVAASELGDKTQIASGAFGAIYKDPLVVFLAAISALALVIGLNVFVGSKLAKNLPVKTIRIASGVLFILFGVFFILF